MAINAEANVTNVLYAMDSRRDWKTPALPPPSSTRVGHARTNSNQESAQTTLIACSRMTRRMTPGRTSASTACSAGTGNAEAGGWPMADSPNDTDASPITDAPDGTRAPGDTFPVLDDKAPSRG